MVTLGNTNQPVFYKTLSYAGAYVRKHNME
jgi:hypothetical protein